jgi:hypothetical protein
MTESNGRCVFESQDYCCPPERLTKNGFKCSSALPMQPGDITNKCGASDADLMTEEEYERFLKFKNDFRNRIFGLLKQQRIKDRKNERALRKWNGRL